MRTTPAALAALLALTPLPLVAEEPVTAAPVDEDRPPWVVAATWCMVEVDDEDDVASCDAGLAAAMRSWRATEDLWRSWVVFAGERSAGTGFAWSRRAGRFVVGAGVGVAASYPTDGGGIDLGDVRGVVGVTIGLSGVGGGR
jgi:hypothetical protein